MTNTLSICASDTSGGNVSEMEGTKGYTTSSATSGYTFVGGEYITLAVTGKGVTSRPTTEIMKQYTVASGSSGSNALTYAKDADGSTTTYAFDWLGTGETISLRAWSDGKASTPAAPATDPDGQPFTVESTQDGSVRELLYSPATDYPYGIVAVSLYHQLARMVITVTHDDTTDPFSAITLGCITDKVPVTGTFYKPTSGNNYGTWAVDPIGTSPAHWGIITPKQESVGVYSAVVIPATYASGTRFINFTVNGQDFSYTLPAAITLAPGKQYNYNITVKNTAITVTTDITDWNAAVDGTDYTHGHGYPHRVRLPIEYVAPYNMNSPITMATDNLRTSSMYFSWNTNTSTTGGATEGPKADIRAMINGTALRGYHLPSIAEWATVIAPTGVQTISNRSETAAWGVTNNNTKDTYSADKYAYEVYRVFYNDYECPPSSTIGYGLRFKEKVGDNYENGQYTCAYRYEYNAADSDVGGGASLTVNVIYVGPDPTVTIGVISNESWWASPEYTVVLPACGYSNYSYGSNQNPGWDGAINATTFGAYWSATQSGADYAYDIYFNMSPDHVRGKGKDCPGSGFPIRLFRDSGLGSGPRFSVGPGTTVQFSPGNLQAKISSGPMDTHNYTASDWRFAANQWDHLYNPLDADAVTNKEWVDFFAWIGTSASWNTYGLCTNTTYDEDNGDAYHGTSENDALKTDWGSIPDVITTLGVGWRTLTADEWDYLFNTRVSGATVNGVNNARYTEATIRTDIQSNWPESGNYGESGMILFPDGVTIDESEATTWGAINAASNWDTKCTAEQWTVLEAKGCVFLPAAGNGHATGVYRGGGHGRYWSASPLDAGGARDVLFRSDYVNAQQNDGHRSYQCSVRLVRNK